MVNKNSKKLVFGALSAIAASVAAGVFVKKTMQNKGENDSEKENKKKKSKNDYYTVSLNEIYNTYEDKTFSEEDMINEIKKEISL